MRRVAFILALLALAAGAHAWQAKERAIMVREAVIYLKPDANSPRLGVVWRGRDVALIDKSREWLQIFGTAEENREVTGWILDKGVIRTSTPDGDRILFGEAVESEAEASRRGGRRNAGRDAMRLYYRVYEYFPQSPLAPEGLYRAADIRWQLERAEVLDRPSAREGNPDIRSRMNEDALRELKKKFPGTRYEALAEFLLIENKTCGDWSVNTKCPEKESELYEKHATEYPQSPKAAEALYEAARRQAALIEMYKTEGKSGKSNEARIKAKALTQRLLSQYAQSDYAYRAARLAYMIDNDLPTFGNMVQ